MEHEEGRVLAWRRKRRRGRYPHSLFFLIALMLTQGCQAWGWFSPPTTETNTAHHHAARENRRFDGSVAEFSMDGLNDEKGKKLVADAKHKLVGPHSCWQTAYQQLFAGCSQIMAEEEKRRRFAWHLSDCFQRDSGREAFPYCDWGISMINCLKRLTDDEHKVYLEFLLETNSICHQLQTHAFKGNIERLVNDLKDSAEKAEQQLENIHEQTTSLLQDSDQIHNSLNSIDLRVQNVGQTTKKVDDQMDNLSQHSEAIAKQSKEISKSQSELREEQVRMNVNLKEGMEVMREAYTDLGRHVSDLRNEASEIEKKISVVGETVSSRMENLQNTAYDIENMAGRSLDKQQEVLQGQSTALNGLKLLTKFQSHALEESRETLGKLAEHSRKQQEELLQSEEQIHKVHARLVENSKSILTAQEAFESKQATMFAALERLFALHSAMLLESRIIKAFFIYSLSIFIIYMFTSTKQTYTVRAQLYIGLCATFLIEVGILRITSRNIEQQAWLVNLIRSLYMVLASVQFLHAIYAYRDYDVLNHQMIQTLIEKVNAIQRKREVSWEAGSDMNWSSWIQTELPEDVHVREDPDYAISEEIGENSVAASATRKYNLRSHRH